MRPAAGRSKLKSQLVHASLCLTTTAPKRDGQRQLGAAPPLRARRGAESRNWTEATGLRRPSAEPRAMGCHQRRTAAADTAPRSGRLPQRGGRLLSCCWLSATRPAAGRWLSGCWLLAAGWAAGCPWLGAERPPPEPRTLLPRTPVRRAANALYKKWPTGCTRHRSDSWPQHSRAAALVRRRGALCRARFR